MNVQIESSLFNMDSQLIKKYNIRGRHKGKPCTNLTITYDGCFYHETRMARGR